MLEYQTTDRLRAARGEEAIEIDSQQKAPRAAWSVILDGRVEHLARPRHTPVLPF